MKKYYKLHTANYPRQEIDKYFEDSESEVIYE